MSVNTRKIISSVLGVLLSIPLCGFAAFAATASESKSGLASGAGAGSGSDNSWQIVSGAYDSSHATSEGLGASELAGYGFVESADGRIRVTKTVESTATEDLFLMHLSVDACAVSTQVTDYSEFFKNAEYMATSSNNYHSDDCGTVLMNLTGNQKVNVSGQTIAGGKSSTFEIQDPQGNVIAQGVKLYWDSSNNCTMVMKVDDGRYVLLGISVKDGGQNTARLSEEAYEYVKKAFAAQVASGTPPTLETVSDVMGSNVEYAGLGSPDAGTVGYDQPSRTLTWRPSYSASCKKVDEDPSLVEERDPSSGAVTKVTITQRSWYYGAAKLKYYVYLNTQSDGFASSYDPDQATNAFETNASATLSYSYTDDGGQSVQSGSVDFPKPSVKGIQYDLCMKKTDDLGTPLAGATFKLVRSWTDVLGNRYTDVVADDLVSDSNGLVTATSLSWGTYTLEEISAPPGHTLPENAADRTATFTLCYTDDSSKLTSSTLVDASEHHAMPAGQVPSIENGRVKTDVTLLKTDASDSSKTISGAGYALYTDNGDGVFSRSDDIIPANLVCEVETSDDGKAVFPQLTAGMYFLVETHAPAGYELSEKAYRIDVYGVKGAAGGADDNMICVGAAVCAYMQPPYVPNTVTVADKAIPVLPTTAGPGTGRLVMIGGIVLFVLGAAAFAGHRMKSRSGAWDSRHM